MRSLYEALLKEFPNLMVETGCRERNVQQVDFGGFFNTIYRTLYLGRDDYSLEGRSLSEYKVDGRLKGLFCPRAVYLTTERLTVDLLSKDAEFKDLDIPTKYSVQWNGKNYSTPAILQRDYEDFTKLSVPKDLKDKLKGEYESALAKLINNFIDKKARVLTASEFMEAQDAIVANMRKTPEHNTNLEELIREVEIASVSSKISYNGSCHYSEPAFLPIKVNVKLYKDLWYNTDNYEMVRELSLSIIRQFK